MASKYPRAHSPFWWIKYKKRSKVTTVGSVSSGLRRDQREGKRNSADKLVDRYEREESKSATNGDRQHSAFVEWVPGFLESNYNTLETAKTSFEAYGWRWHSVAKF